MDVKLWIVTGGRGCGKSTFCREVVQTARLAGWDAAGLLSPADFTEGMKEIIWAEDIRSGERRPLANTHPQTENDLAFGEWFFSRETFEWGNQLLKASVPCDLLVIDELGPLEFDLASGWVSAFDVIQRAGFRLALVVIRPELCDAAQKRFQTTQTIRLNNVSEVKSIANNKFPHF